MLEMKLNLEKGPISIGMYKEMYIASDLVRFK